MNINNYDYFGNYSNNDETPLFSVNDIQKKAKEKEQNRNRIYYKISKKCFEKIKEMSSNDESYCFFKIPEYIPGYPLFNMTECVLYLLNLLNLIRSRLLISSEVNLLYVYPYNLLLDSMRSVQICCMSMV